MLVIQNILATSKYANFKFGWFESADGYIFSVKIAEIFRLIYIYKNLFFLQDYDPRNDPMLHHSHTGTLSPTGCYCCPGTNAIKLFLPKIMAPFILIFDLRLLFEAFQL